MAKKSVQKNGNGNGENFGFEQRLWQAAGKMRGHMAAAEDKHVVFGLFFLNTHTQNYKAKLTDEVMALRDSVEGFTNSLWALSPEGQLAAAKRA